jgi:hypothetical protein
VKAIMLQGKKTHQCTLRFNFKPLKKVQVKFTLQHVMKAQSVGKSYSCALSLASVLSTRSGCVGGECHTPTSLRPGNRPDTHCTGGCKGHGGQSGWCRKSCPSRVRTPDCPACSNLIYWLHYPGSLWVR